VRVRSPLGGAARECQAPVFRRQRYHTGLGEVLALSGGSSSDIRARLPGCQQNSRLARIQQSYMFPMGSHSAPTPDDLPSPSIKTINMNVRVALFCITALLIVANPARADLLPNNFWTNSTFESGLNLNQTNGTPTNWIRDGGDTTICQVITNKSVSSSHSLAVIDNAAGDFGEWRSDVSLSGNATNGDVLNIQWYEMYNLSAPEMRLTVQFFNASSNDVGTVHFTTSGTSSSGWVSTIANSTFTKRNAALVVPLGAVTMRCALVSGGDPAITGVMVIDDLSVARVARLLPGNFWVNPTFESGANLDQTNGTPANWTRGGGDTTICQVTTSNSVSSSHSLAVIDNNGNTVTGYGEWFSDVSLLGKASPGDALDIQWFEMFTNKFSSTFMRLTVQFFNASSNVVGTQDFTTGTNTLSAGWVSTIANSTFTKRNGVLLVPAGAVRMRCSLASGGFPGTTGVMVIDDLSVARAPVPGNFWVNSTFELGTDLDQTNGTPANWTRGGGDMTIDQVTTSNSVSLSHALAVIDNNTDIDLGYGEWYSDVSLIGNATNGQSLNIQWFEMYNVSPGPQHEMRLTAQFFNANNDLVGETHFITTGTSSPGWVSTIADSTFTKRNGALFVPVGAVRLRCSLVSGGSGEPTGVMVIDDLTVALNSAVPVIPPTVLAGNFFPNPTFELGSDLDSPSLASVVSWTRGGSDNTMDQVTTNNSVSPTHSLSLVDNDFTYGEWYQYLTLSGVAPDDVLDVQFFRIYSTTNGPMRLTFGFRTAGGADLGNVTNFFGGDPSGGQSPGWLGSVATSPFERVFGRFLVPADAGQLSVKFASGGAGDVTGTMVIDDLSVRISKPVITSITADSGGKTITWFSMPSKLYTVQFASALGSPTVWTSLTNGMPGDLSLSNTYLDAATHAGAAGFYRVIQQ
jgi:hypothetical protein